MPSVLLRRQTAEPTEKTTVKLLVELMVAEDRYGVDLRVKTHNMTSLKSYTLIESESEALQVK